MLAFNDTGRAVLKTAKERFPLLNAGEPSPDPYWIMEQGWGDLYGLFAVDSPEPPGREAARRIYYHKEC